MTNTDAERVSDIVARLRREADGRDTEPDQFAEEVTADMRSAADIIEAQSKALAAARELIEGLREWCSEAVHSTDPDISEMGAADLQRIDDFMARTTPTPENPNG